MLPIIGTLYRLAHLPRSRSIGLFILIQILIILEHIYLLIYLPLGTIDWIASASILPNKTRFNELANKAMDLVALLSFVGSGKDKKLAFKFFRTIYRKRVSKNNLLF